MVITRISVIFLLGIFLVSGIACGGGGEPIPTPTTTPIPTATLTPTPTMFLSCDIQWNEAKYYIGKFKTVCGTVVGTYYDVTSNGQPTFLNIGKPYPDPDRFIVIIWGEDRGKFYSPPEDYYLGKNINVIGLIMEYEGIAKIEVWRPSQIEEY